MAPHWALKMFPCTHYQLQCNKTGEVVTSDELEATDKQALLEKNITEARSTRKRCPLPGCKNLTTSARQLLLRESFNELCDIYSNCLAELRGYGERYHSIPFCLRADFADASGCTQTHQTFGIGTQPISEDPSFNHWIRAAHFLSCTADVLFDESISSGDATDCCKQVNECRWHVVRIVANNRVLKKGVEKIESTYMKRKAKSAEIRARQQEEKSEELRRILNWRWYRKNVRHRKHWSSVSVDGHVKKRGEGSWRLTACFNAPRVNWMHRLQELEEVLQL